MIRFITLNGSKPAHYFTWLHPKGLVPYIWDGIFPAGTSLQRNLHHQLAEPERQGYYGINGIWDYGWAEHVLTPFARENHDAFLLTAPAADATIWPRPATNPQVETVNYPYRFMTLNEMAGQPIAPPAIGPLQGYLSLIDPNRQISLSARLVPPNFVSHAHYPRCWI